MKYSKQPREIGLLSKSTLNRIAALAMMMLFVTSVVSSRFGVIDFGGPFMMSSIVSACIASLVLVSSRTSYLPFLGEAVFPSSLLKEPSDPADATVTVEVDAGRGATHVAFWASESKGYVVKNPWDAYDQYSNSGISVVKGGKATLNVRCPAQYAVRGRVLPRHVHFRDIYPSGIVGEVKTAQVVCA